MIRRRYNPGISYDVSFKKDQGVVMRKFSPTSAEEVKIDPRKHIPWRTVLFLHPSETAVRMLQVRG